VKVDERVARRRDQGSEAGDELDRRHHSVRLVLAPWSLQTVSDAPVGEHRESLERKWRASAVAEQKLAAEMREDAALQVGAKLALHVARKTTPVVAPRLGQEGLEMTCDQGVEQRVLGRPSLVARRADVRDCGGRGAAHTRERANAVPGSKLTRFADFKCRQGGDRHLSPGERHLSLAIATGVEVLSSAFDQPHQRADDAGKLAAHPCVDRPDPYIADFAVPSARLVRVRTAHPLITPRGTSFATFLDTPAPWITSTTSCTSLYASLISSPSVR
jgi:hypothetical protein